MSAMEPLPLLVTTFGVAIVAYFAVAIGLLYLVHPVRMKMVAIAESMLSDAHWTESEREEINLLLDTAWSFRVGLILPLAVVGSIINDLIGRPAPCPDRLGSDPRFHHLFGRYLVAILAANPLAALVTVPLMALCVVVRLVTVAIQAFRDSDYRDLSNEVWECVEEPLVRAAHGMALAKAA